jgi:hypothetical protein
MQLERSRPPVPRKERIITENSSTLARHHCQGCQFAPQIDPDRDFLIAVGCRRTAEDEHGDCYSLENDSKDGLHLQGF